MRMTDNFKIQRFQTFVLKLDGLVMKVIYRIKLNRIANNIREYLFTDSVCGDFEFSF